MQKPLKAKNGKNSEPERISVCSVSFSMIKQEKIRKQSLENMKNNQEELNAYDREKINEKSSFIHHFANNNNYD